jgi:hypothetical protein
MLHSKKKPKSLTPIAAPASPWIAPPSTNVKVNVDAAVFEHENRGITVVIC